MDDKKSGKVACGLCGLASQLIYCEPADRKWTPWAWIEDETNRWVRPSLTRAFCSVSKDRFLSFTFPFLRLSLESKTKGGPLSWPSLDSNKSIFLQACKVFPFALELFCFEIPIQFQLIQLFRNSLSFKLNSVVIPLHYAQCTESLPARITPAYDGLESHISRPIRP